ncbi:DUF5331 domain-containing protein [Calothrix sp. 336/3]|uniref:DUF5331 domain-containing protein n=1 Tax=Calothrix sp. 336/3 TaxID=1337936 RepID=UPI0006994E0D|nr:DUF5331 domain-containing protein [Calothrix sp. 336/3]
MNIQELRESLRLKWVSYYSQNRSWLVKMRIWASYDGLRRPSSGFILATLSTLEPQLGDILPLLVELNSNPDEIINALGLNFNPDEEIPEVRDHHSASRDYGSNGVGKVNGCRKYELSEKFHSESQVVEHKKQTTSCLTVVLDSKNGHKAILPIAIHGNGKHGRKMTLIRDNHHHHNGKYADSPVVGKRHMGTSGQSLSHLPSKSSDEISPQIIKSTRIANWVDDFCQGVNWDEKDSTFLPF